MSWEGIDEFVAVASTLRFGQAARFAGLAATAGTVGGDPHIDRVAFRAFHHAAMFNP